MTTIDALMIAGLLAFIGGTYAYARWSAAQGWPEIDAGDKDDASVAIAASIIAAG